MSAYQPDLKHVTIAVTPTLVHTYGAPGALVVTQIHYWAEFHNTDWFEASYEDLANLTGLTPPACRNQVQKLVDAGALEKDIDIGAHGYKKCRYRALVDVLSSNPQAGSGSESATAEIVTTPPEPAETAIDEISNPIDEIVNPGTDEISNPSSLQIRESKREREGDSEPEPVGGQLLSLLDDGIDPYASGNTNPDVTQPPPPLDTGDPAVKFAVWFASLANPDADLAALSAKDLGRRWTGPAKRLLEQKDRDWLRGIVEWVFDGEGQEFWAPKCGSVKAFADRVGKGTIVDQFDNWQATQARAAIRTAPPPSDPPPAHSLIPEEFQPDHDPGPADFGSLSPEFDRFRNPVRKEAS